MEFFIQIKMKTFLFLYTYDSLVSCTIGTELSVLNMAPRRSEEEDWYKFLTVTEYHLWKGIWL